MSTLLHVTSGTAIVSSMRRAGVVGAILPWNDVLHEGPVPAGLNVAALGERRAEFLASCGWGSAESLGRETFERDRVLDDAAAGRTRPFAVDEIVLWLEHDLYDQLQLLQILDRLPLDGAPRITAVPDADYLGHLPTAAFDRLFSARRDVTSAERIAARDAWQAFRDADPRAIVDVLPRVSVLRHLGPALLRHLQQFPSIANGLSRTEQHALQVLSSGPASMANLFHETQRREQAFFMGDAAFVVHLSALVHCTPPLLATSRGDRRLQFEDEVTRTDFGRRVLDHAADRVVSSGIERWLGGVQLSGNGPTWRWDPDHHTVRIA